MMHVGLVSWEALLSRCQQVIYIANSQREIISSVIYICIVQCKMYTFHVVKSVVAARLTSIEENSGLQVLVCATTKLVLSFACLCYVSLHAGPL